MLASCMKSEVEVFDVFGVVVLEEKVSKMFFPLFRRPRAYRGKHAISYLNER